MKLLFLLSLIFALPMPAPEPFSADSIRNFLWGGVATLTGASIGLSVSSAKNRKKYLDNEN
jgi:hypothetical protein